jgi:uncharacterized protein (UPF0333 family)
MKINKEFKLTMAVALSAALLTLTAIGCGGGSGGGEDKQTADARAAATQITRDLLIKSGGDLSKLTPEEKKVLLDTYHGNEDSVRLAYQMMKRGTLTDASSVAQPK